MNLDTVLKELATIAEAHPNIKNYRFGKYKVGEEHNSVRINEKPTIKCLDLNNRQRIYSLVIDFKGVLEDDAEAFFLEFRRRYKEDKSPWRINNATELTGKISVYSYSTYNIDILVQGSSPKVEFTYK